MQQPKSTEWTEKRIAENYEFARPLDEKIVLDLFGKIESITQSSFGGRLLLDAGCGTGRLSFPLAAKHPSLNVVGLDKSDVMLCALKKKITASGMKNYNLVNGDLSDLAFEDNYFDFSLVSSVLHSIADWRQIVLEIVRVTKDNCFLLHVSEESDMYNFVLNRVKNNGKTPMEKFWLKYTELREKNGLPSPENSQVGIKWRLGSPELTDFLKEQRCVAGLEEFDVQWEQLFTVADLLRIVEYRLYSSMFTADDKKYAEVANDMRKWIEAGKLPLNERCASKNTLRCEIIKIKKKG